MTFEESWQLSEWTTSFFNARQNEWHQYQQGLVDREVWDTIERVIHILMGMDWFQRWWRDYGSKNLMPSFVAQVDRIVASPKRDAVTELSDVLNVGGPEDSIRD